MAQPPIGPEDGTGHHPGHDTVQAFIIRPMDSFLKSRKLVPGNPDFNPRQFSKTFFYMESPDKGSRMWPALSLMKYGKGGLTTFHAISGLLFFEMEADFFKKQAEDRRPLD
jgi:hypothetical protein